MTFTNLTKTGMAMLRYVTNDITWLSYENSGKRTHIKMGPIIGRNDDMLTIRGVNFFPGQVEDIVHKFDDLAPMFLLTVDRIDSLDRMRIDVETVDGLQLSDSEKGNLSGQVVAIIKDTIGVSVSVFINEYGIMPRSEGGKISKIKDLRHIRPE